MYSTVNIVMIVALPEEYDIVKEAFPSIGDKSTDSHVRLMHDLGVPGYTLTSILSEEMGSENALISAISAMEDLCPDLVICIGIAGGLLKDASLGDVCVSNEIIDILHNSKVVDAGVATDTEVSPSFYNIDPEIIATCRFLRSHPNLEPKLVAWRRECDARKQLISKDKRGQNLPGFDADKSTNFHVGTIICGPVSASQNLNKKLKTLNRKVLAIETESGGIFKATTSKGVPAVTIRGICDLANLDKGVLEINGENEIRRLAMENALSFLKLQFSNPLFFRPATKHNSMRRNGQDKLKLFEDESSVIIDEITTQITNNLKELSLDFKNKPDGYMLPLPRLKQVAKFDDYDEEAEIDPLIVKDALESEDTLFVRLGRSIPDQTLAWTMAHVLLKSELNNKQVLPVVIKGERIVGPSGSFDRCFGRDLSSLDIDQNFQLVFLIDEPIFNSKTRMKFMADEIKRFPNAKAIILTKAETPVDEIDLFRERINATDFVLTPVPFLEIAMFLERAFEMEPAEAEAVATKITETFSKFKLHADPSYFSGIDENAISALINANRRAELIQLAVDGLLSLIVAIDESATKLSRSTREEFLQKLVYEIKVEKRVFDDSGLLDFAVDFGQQKLLDVEPLLFVSGFFKGGVLNRVSGKIQFSQPFVESYLLARRLKENDQDAKLYFDVHDEMFDHYSFDLYCELGATPSVVQAVLDYCQTTTSIESSMEKFENVYLERSFKPLALRTPKQLVHMGQNLGNMAEKIASEESNGDNRKHKQRLIDARETVREKVGTQREEQRKELSEETKSEFAMLDSLSRSLSLSTTLLGSGAEKLDKENKKKLSRYILDSADLFSHHWTCNRRKLNFDLIREEISSDEMMNSFIDEFGLDIDDKQKIKQELILFLADQEMRLLSGPLGVVLNRIVTGAGIYALRPTIRLAKPENKMQEIIKAVWLLDVDPIEGKNSLKQALQQFKGSDFLRFVIANHLIWRIFWYHWKSKAKRAFVDAAHLALRPLGLLPSKKTLEKAIKGSSN